MSDACSLAGKEPASRCSVNQGAALTATILFGLVELFVITFALPRFEAIFNGLLRGFYRPPITTLLVDFLWAFVALTALWMFASLCLHERRLHPGWSYVLLATVIAQTVFTVIALFLPLTVTIQTLH